MKIFDWQDIPMLGKNVYDVFDELFYRSEKAGMETQDENVIMTEAPKDKLVDFQIEFFDGEQGVILYGKCHYIGGKIESVKIR